MTIRRVLLIILLAALGACAVTGCFALVATGEDTIIALLVTAFFVACGVGLMLPLTMLTDRPRFRAAGFVCMAVVLLVLGSVLGLFWSDMSRSGRRYEDLFGMLLVFTLVTGLPAAGALFLVSYKWARVAVWTLVTLAAYAFGVCLLSVAMSAATMGNRFGPGSYEVRQRVESIWATGLIPFGIGAIAAILLVNVGCGDRRLFRWPGVMLAGVTALLGVALVWTDPAGDFWYRMLALLIILAATAAHTNLVLMAKLRANLRWLLLLSLGSAYGTAIVGVIACASGSAGPDFLRIAAAGGIATFCSSLALIVLVFFNRKTGLPPVVSTQMSDMELTCPRCGDRQTVSVGDSVCRGCELRISVSVAEPRCPGCGYLLFRLTSDRCPECGAVVRSGAASQPAAIPEAAIAEAPAVL